MFVTTHAVAGAALGSVLAGPGGAAHTAGALVAGVASHLAMDALPHAGKWRDDADFLRAARIDGLLGLGVMGVAAARARNAPTRATVIASMIGAVLPDVAHPVRHWTGRSPYPGWFDRFHVAIQRERRERVPAEVAFGVLLAAVVLPRVGRTP